jgi:hypothetical protein
MTAAKSPGAVAAHGAFEIDQLGGTVISKDSPHRKFTQVVRAYAGDRPSHPLTSLKGGDDRA